MELEERLRSARATREDWQVYCDLLIEQGDAHGELVALGLAAERAESSIERDKLARLLATLSRNIDPELHERARRQGSFFRIDWEYGFVARARVVERWDRATDSALDGLRDLLTAPGARFLRRLEIDREHEGDAGLRELGARGIFEWAAPAFATASLPQVRSFRVGSAPTEEMHLSEASSVMITSGAPGTPGARIFRPNPWIGDVSQALAAMPNLEELHLTGEGIRFETLPEQLRSLTIETRFLRKAALRAFGSASLPRLESLELWLGHWPDSLPRFDGPETDAYYGPRTGAADLADLLDGHRLGALRRLALSNCAWMPELASAVATSKIALQLESLDLSYGFMNGRQATPLVEHADRLQHLSRLDLSNNQIDEPTQRRLREAFGSKVILDAQGDLEGSSIFRLIAFR